MRLGAMLYALHVNALGVVASEAAHEGLTHFHAGETMLQFLCDQTHRLLLVVSSAAAAGKVAARHLASMLLVRCGVLFGDMLPAAGPPILMSRATLRKSLAPDLRTMLEALPRWMLRQVVETLVTSASPGRDAASGTRTSNHGNRGGSLDGGPSGSAAVPSRHDTSIRVLSATVLHSDELCTLLTTRGVCESRAEASERHEQGALRWTATRRGASQNRAEQADSANWAAATALVNGEGAPHNARPPSRSRLHRLVSCGLSFSPQKTGSPKRPAPRASGTAHPSPLLFWHSEDVRTHNWTNSQPKPVGNESACNPTSH